VAPTSATASSGSQQGTTTGGPAKSVFPAAPLRPLPDGIINLDRFRVRRRDRAGGVIHE
jgi:hypothetical protein